MSREDALAMSREDALAMAEDHFANGRFLADLRSRVGYRTESVVPGCAPELHRYLAEALTPDLEAMGFTCRIYDNPRQDAGPILVARRQEAKHLPTVMSYAHGDVVPGMEGGWRDGISPWDITIQGDRWYGRGTADNKGQHSINLAALKAVLDVRGALGFNMVILVEMGEEKGSPGLHEFCRANRPLFDADVFIASDGPRIAPTIPTIFMGSRGVFNFTMRLQSHAGGHHSGNWGGLLTNPAIVMAHAIASLTDEKGRILIDEWRNSQMSDSVRAAIARLRVDGGEDAPTINPEWGEPGLSAEEKLLASNSFEIRAIVAGNPDRPANAIPPSAEAHGHIRYVAGTDPDSLLPALRQHLDAAGFGDIEIAMDGDPMHATRLDPDHPWARWVTASLSRTHGGDIAVMPNLGGSLPNDVFAEILGLPTIWIPHSYSGCSQHAPDEHVLAPICREALRLMTGLWWDLGAGGTPSGP